MSVRRRAARLAIGIASGLASLVGCGAHGDEQALPAVLTPQAGVTVSGISAGGYMATQFHVAHSALVDGAALLASGPYFCAEGSLRHALGRCMEASEPIPVDRLIGLTSGFALEASIDPIAGLAGDRVWILHGSVDHTVARPVVDALEQYYRALVAPEGLVRIERDAAGHTFPTLASGGNCKATESPFIGACGFDAAGALLAHLLGPLQPRSATHQGRVLEFDQRVYADRHHSDGLADRGWLFVPASCASGGNAACRLHIAFHGCKQGRSFIGDEFVVRAGYLEWASSNSLVVLFPQIEPGFRPLNPNGCWDWWGYEDADHVTRRAPQIAAIRAMVADLRGETTTN